MLGRERPHAVDDARVAPADRREREARLGLLRGGARLGDEEPGDLLRPDLVELVDLAQDLVHGVDPETAVEALGDPAVVDQDADLGHPDVAQRAERLRHDERQLDLVVVRQLARADDVDVRLRELAEPPVLGALAAPHLLDLVALEREGEVPGVLQHVAREGDREVEVQAELLVALVPAGVVGVADLLLQAPQDVDLLGRLALAQELVERLDRARLDPAEPVQLEHAAQGVEDVLLDDPTVGEPFGETGEGCGPGHGSDLPRRRHGRPHRPGRRTGRPAHVRPRGTGWSRARARPWSRARGPAARPTRGRGARRRRAACGPSSRRPRRAGPCGRPSPRRARRR